MASAWGRHAMFSILARGFGPQVTSAGRAAPSRAPSNRDSLLSVSGCITALATPFTAAGDLDLDAWRRLLDLQLAGGVQAVVVAGSTGEAAALEDEEYLTLIRSAVAHLDGRIPVIAGTGQMNTAKTIAQTRLAASAGAQLALVVVPAYVRPTQAGMAAHFTAVAEQGGLPVLLYNVPGRTGSDLLPETVATLATHPGIVGIKEARAEAERMQALLALRAPDFAVLSGDDGTALRAMLAGADGLVSVGSNALPRSFSRLCALAAAGHAAEAHALDAQLAAYHAFNGVESNPIPVKALLQRLGMGQGLRLPLLPLSAPHVGQADTLAAKIAVLEATSGRTPLAA